MIAWLLCVLLGLSLGSFVSLCVERLPKGESLMGSRSHCTRCQTRLRIRELVPLVSFIRQNGRCAHCHQRISFLYPLLELFSAIIVIWSVSEFGLGLEALRLILLLLLLLLIAVVDARHFLIPDRLLLFGAVAAITLQAFLHLSRIPAMLLGGLAAGLVVYLLYRAGNYFFKKKTMGLGDIKLSAFLGMILGVKLFLFSFWIGCVLGALYGLVRMFAFKAPPDAKIPFGTMLAISSALLILFPETFMYLLDQWLNLN